MHALGTPTEHAARSFVREHNISFLKRALQAEADPDDRRVIRRLLREQERIYAAEPLDGPREARRGVASQPGGSQPS